MQALVTGAAGFIGSHLCETLLRQGWSVVGLDNFDDFYNPAVKHENIAGCISQKAFHLVEADIRDRSVLMTAAAADIDVIVHLAARAGVRPSIEQPILYNDVNINGTMALLEAARHHHIRRFIFASSSSVYGNNRKVPFSEDDNVDYPISPYAATKKAGELLCHTYHHLYDIDMTCLRFFTVYGPRQRPDLAIHKFARLMEKGEPIPVYGDGSMRRDFTFIADIVQGILGAIRTCRGYHIYNLGESRPVTVNQLIEALEKALDKRARRKVLPTQPGDVDCTYADVTKAVADLGYAPSTHLEDGLRAFVAWLRSS